MSIKKYRLSPATPDWLRPARTVNETYVLEIRHAPTQVFRLSSGELTSDRKRATEDLASQRNARADESLAVAAALLRAPLEPTRKHRTPARTQALHRMIAEALLPAGVGEHVLGLGGVSDRAWYELRRLIDLIDVELADVDCWTASLKDAAGARLSLPIDYDPLAYSDAGPHQALTDITVALPREGFARDGSCVHLRPDEVDDDGRAVEGPLESLTSAFVRTTTVDSR